MPVTIRADEALPQLRFDQPLAPVLKTIGTTAEQVLPANPLRRRFIIQNTGTTKMLLVLGNVEPTTTVYTVALSACTAANDGLGGTYIDEGFTGQVRCLSSGAGGTVVVQEFQ